MTNFKTLIHPLRTYVYVRDMTYNKTHLGYLLSVGWGLELERRSFAPACHLQGPVAPSRSYSKGHPQSTSSENGKTEGRNRKTERLKNVISIYRYVDYLTMSLYMLPCNRRIRNDMFSNGVFLSPYVWTPSLPEDITNSPQLINVIKLYISLHM